MTKFSWLVSGRVGIGIRTSVSRICALNWYFILASEGGERERKEKVVYRMSPGLVIRICCRLPSFPWLRVYSWGIHLQAGCPWRPSALWHLVCGDLHGTLQYGLHSLLPLFSWTELLNCFRTPGPPPPKAVFGWKQDHVSLARLDDICCVVWYMMTHCHMQHAVLMKIWIGMFTIIKQNSVYTWRHEQEGI